MFTIPSRSETMTLELLIRYFHFISILATVSTLVAEWLLTGHENARREIARLARIDLVYGISSITLVAAGLTLWFGGLGKPAAFYSDNPIFLIKVGLALVLGLLSLPPTFYFLRERKGNPDEIIRIPVYVRRCIQAELAMVFLIPMLAVLMARGVGY